MENCLVLRVLLSLLLQPARPRIARGGCICFIFKRSTCHLIHGNTISLELVRICFLLPAAAILAGVALAVSTSTRVAIIAGNDGRTDCLDFRLLLLDFLGTGIRICVDPCPAILPM